MKIKKLFIAAIVIAPIIGCGPTALEECKERVSEQTDRCYFEAKERFAASGGSVPMGMEVCFAYQLKEDRWCDRKYGAESK